MSINDNHRDYFVYILTNRYSKVLYVGSTNDLCRRIYEHKHCLYKNSFTDKYNVTKLVYYELVGDMPDARHREWLLKRWRREWKVKLIKSINPKWKDLYESIL